MPNASCLCGGVAWQAEEPLELMTHCHCSMCRKAHGVAFATYVAVAAPRFRWLHGEDQVARFESSPGFHRPFCSRCGSVVAEDPGDDERVFMPAGCLDDDTGARAVAHIFASSKAPWHEIVDALPRFDAYQPGFDAPKVPERDAPPDDGRIHGSCLCGAVAYALSQEPKLIINCHCSRCRKARAAAHASNLFAEKATFVWLRGEDELIRFKLPDAERFTHVFCRSCGSSCPRVAEDATHVVIPAGGLDDDPGARERFHIFTASKAAWYDLPDDGLPRFEESAG